MWLTKDRCGYDLWMSEPEWNDDYGRWPRNPVSRWSIRTFERKFPHLKMRAGKGAIVEVDIEMRKKKGG